MSSTTNLLVFTGLVYAIHERMKLTPIEKKNFWKWGLAGIWWRRHKQRRWEEKHRGLNKNHEDLKVIANYYWVEAQSVGVDMSRAEAMAMAFKHSIWSEGRLIPTLEPFEVTKHMGKVRDI